MTHPNTQAEPIPAMYQLRRLLGNLDVIGDAFWTEWRECSQSEYERFVKDPFDSLRIKHEVRALYVGAPPAPPAAEPAQPTELERQMREALVRAQTWHNGSAWRFDVSDTKVAAWHLHREELAAALSAYDAAHPHEGRAEG